MKDVRSWRNAVGIKDMRILTKDVVLEEFYMTVDQNLSTEHGKELKKLIYEFGPDIIILHYPNPFVTHYLLKYKNRKFKLIVYWHLDITKQKLLKHLFRRQNVKLIERANKILDTNQSTLMNQHLQRCSKERNKFFLI